MQLEEHKVIYRRIIAAVSAGDVDALDAVIHPNLVDHNPVAGQAPGRDGFKQWMARARGSFPDLQGTVEHIIAEHELHSGAPR